MEELENLESTESDVEQKRILEQVVIDKDLPVSMRTIQVPLVNNTFDSIFVRLCNFSMDS